MGCDSPEHFAASILKVSPPAALFTHSQVRSRGPMKLRLILPAAALALALGTASAADWPQFRGPDRSGLSKETGLLKAFPEGGPKLLWTFEQGGVGYSGPAIVGDRLYCAGANEDADKEFVFCLDVKSGKELWRTPFPKLSDETKLLAQFGG